MNEPRLLAISDLHVTQRLNHGAVAQLPPHLDDWLIVAGDVGDTPVQLEETLAALVPKFARVLWAPGNHELWSPLGDPLRGVDRYLHLVELCRRHGVVTPEDPFPRFTSGGQKHIVAPLFLLYDHSFRPADMPLKDAVTWAHAAGLGCRDDWLLDPVPYPSIVQWCAARCAAALVRLEAIPRGLPIVLVNHFPLRHDLVRLAISPHFDIWCGTRLTEDWHTRFRVEVVVTGHLHTRATDWRDAVRFEEVSLGYESDWQPERGLEVYLREILPATSRPEVVGREDKWQLVPP